MSELNRLKTSVVEQSASEHWMWQNLSKTGCVGQVTSFARSTWCSAKLSLMGPKPAVATDCRGKLGIQAHAPTIKSLPGQGHHKMNAIARLEI